MVNLYIQCTRCIVQCVLHTDCTLHSTHVGENLISVDCVNHRNLGNIADNFSIMVRAKAKQFLPSLLQKQILNDVNDVKDD